jgi:hypothetical protein
MARELRIARLRRELMQNSGRRFQRKNHTSNEKEKNGTTKARAVPADRTCDGLEQGTLPLAGQRESKHRTAGPNGSRATGAQGEKLMRKTKNNSAERIADSRCSTIPEKKSGHCRADSRLGDREKYKICSQVKNRRWNDRVL